jgi:quinol monooxygenase YgiN
MAVRDRGCPDARPALCEDLAVIIVSGELEVDAADRDAYLEACREVIVAARRSPDCHAFYLAADPIEPGRINVYEQWDSVAAVEAFRGSGPSSEQTAAIRDARVDQHEVATTTRL